VFIRTADGALSGDGEDMSGGVLLGGLCGYACFTSEDKHRNNILDHAEEENVTPSDPYYFLLIQMYLDIF
jgi:hypothetical protein